MSILFKEKAYLVSIEIKQNRDSVAKGDSLQLTAIGIYSDSSTVDISNSVTWSSSDTGIATIETITKSKSISEVFARGETVGSATITAIRGSLSDNANIDVTAAELGAINVSPTIDSIVKGTTLQFSATGIYTDGSNFDITDQVAWTSSHNGIVTISNASGSQGLATGKFKGNVTITATLGSISGSTSPGGIEVLPADLVSISVTPSNGIIINGLSLQYTAIGTYTDASTSDITASAVWTSSDVSVATIDASGLASSVSEGSANIIASQGAITGSNTILVTAAELVSIAVSPANASLSQGLTLQYTAIGTYSDGSTSDITSSVSWSSINPLIASIDSTGLANGVFEGTTNIIANMNGISDSQNVTVTSKELVSIALTSAKSSIAKGLTVQFNAIGTYTDGSTSDITGSVLWTSSNPAIASIDPSGLVNALSEGSSTITASLGAISASEIVTVTSTELVSIAVTPISVSVAKGLTVQYTAIGTYSDGATSDITGSVTWNSMNSSIATINASGLAFAASEGATKIVASQGAISNTQIIFVTPPELVSIALTPAAASVSKGLTVQYTAIGTYTDASTQDITATATWTSSNTGIASIDATGLASALSEGSSNITAEEDGVNTTVIITVTAPELVSIAVTPVAASVAKGLTVQYTAIGTYTDASTQDITSTATWTSSDTAVASINATGLASALSEGSANITAEEDGINSTEIITVTPPELVSIALTPVNASVSKGLTVQYTAIGTYTDASTQDITATVTWTSSDTAVASINAAGLANGLSVGSSNITASQGAINNSTTLTVTAPELVSIAVTPVNDSVAKGLTVQYTAIGTYTDASTQNITATVTWTSSDTAVASINATGLASALTIGGSTITAAQGAVNNSTTLTVTAPELVSIAVAPENDSVAQGLTLQYTAIGTYTDASTSDITATVTWTTSNAAVSTIDASGLASALSEGAINITASQGAINNSTTLTVTGKVLVSIAVSPVDTSVAKGLPAV